MRLAAGRVLGAVDEAEQVAHLEVLEAVHLVDDRRRAVEHVHDLAGQLEALVLVRGPDVEEQIARRRRRVVRGALEFDERVQLGRARTAEQTVPDLRADAGDAGEVAGRYTEPDRTHEPAQPLQQVPGPVLAARLHLDDQKDGGTAQRHQHGLGQRVRLPVLPERRFSNHRVLPPSSWSDLLESSHGPAAARTVSAPGPILPAGAATATAAPHRPISAAPAAIPAALPAAVRRLPACVREPRAANSPGTRRYAVPPAGPYAEARLVAALRRIPPAGPLRVRPDVADRGRLGDRAPDPGRTAAGAERHGHLPERHREPRRDAGDARRPDPARRPGRVDGPAPAVLERRLGAEPDPLALAAVVLPAGGRLHRALVRDGRTGRRGVSGRRLRSGPPEETGSASARSSYRRW